MSAGNGHDRAVSLPGREKPQSVDQVRVACEAAHEVLTGASPERILELLGELLIARGVLYQLARGRLELAVPAERPTSPAAPALSGAADETAAEVTQAPAAKKKTAKRKTKTTRRNRASGAA